MRWLVRVLLICFAAVLPAGAGVGFWFFLYSADLPGFKARPRYAPAQATRVSDPCLAAESIAIPYDAIGYNLHAALNAAEGHERTGQVVVRMQISRSIFCEPSPILEREVKEWRVAEQAFDAFARQRGHGRMASNRV